jgi:hypothetical protein
MKNSTDGIAVPNKEINLEVNSEKISCLVSRVQNDIGSLANVADSSNTLEITLIYQDYIQAASVTFRLHSGSLCYLQITFSQSLLTFDPESFVCSFLSNKHHD